MTRESQYNAAVNGGLPTISNSCPPVTDAGDLFGVGDDQEVDSGARQVATDRTSSTRSRLSERRAGACLDHFLMASPMVGS